MRKNKYEKSIELAKKIRVISLKMIHYSGSGHIGSILSMADILAYLYENVMKYKPSNPNWEERDIFILSKGHATAGLYIVLAEKGFFPKEWLARYHVDKGKLSGHASHYVPGIEVSTGSLGHGLPIGIGYAIHFKKNNKKNKVFVLLGDGELNEGSNFEALLFAPHHNLDNLKIIIDSNKIQAMGRCENVLNMEPLAQKILDFGWEVIEINGHNFEEIEKAFNKILKESGKPSCIIVNTIKGKGVSFLENTVESHYYKVTEELLKKAYKELGVKDENSF